METTVTTITQKGQVTIPHYIRKYMGVKPYQKIRFKVENKKVILEPVQDFLNLAGSLKSPIKVKVEDLDDLLTPKLKEDYEKELKNN